MLTDTEVRETLEALLEQRSLAYLLQTLSVVAFEKGAENGQKFWKLAGCTLAAAAEKVSRINEGGCPHGRG